jgi:fatty-acyl-CoA synthase
LVGVPDDKWSEAMTAIVVARRYPPNADELIDLVRAKKDSAPTPKHVQFVKELPMTDPSKVLKASSWAGRDRMVG